ncbi:serpentine receptor class gamma-16 [Biomphalaria glabrata]|nr:serpentine receptor class gamma-16-like; partial [Biomphalaria glabrata]
MNITSQDKVCSYGNISEEIVEFFFLLNFFILNAITGSIGLVVNVIKVIVFFKLGLRDSTNISFFVLSLADAGVGLLLIGFSVVFNPLFKDAVTYIEISVSISFYCLTWPYGFFSRVASLMTAVITVERFLCITFPLKVKEILNPTVATVTSVTLTLAVLASVMPAFKARTLGLVFSEKLNQTILGIVLSDDKEEYLSLTYLFSFFAMGVFQILSIVIIVIFTIALTHKFLQITNWRNRVSTKSDELSSKEKRLVKMIIFMSISFLIFSIPGMIFCLFAVFDESFAYEGPCRNLYLIFSSLIFPPDSLNSLVNFFLLLYMSSKFKNVVRLMYEGIISLKKQKP